jgi:hypothetical protein
VTDMKVCRSGYMRTPPTVCRYVYDHLLGDPSPGGICYNPRAMRHPHLSWRAFVVFLPDNLSIPEKRKRVDVHLICYRKKPFDHHSNEAFVNDEEDLTEAIQVNALYLNRVRWTPYWRGVS